MEGAVSNVVPRIDADCGGPRPRATCHVFVDKAWLTKLGTKDDIEFTTFDFAPGVAPSGRPFCQVKVTREFDGLALRVPKSQH